MNVTELIRTLKTNREEFFAKVHALGFSLGERAIKVNDSVAKKIITAWRAAEKREAKKRFFIEEKEEPLAPAKERKITLPAKITVKEFAQKLGKNVTELIAILMQNGIMATINQSLDFETATIIAQDMGYEVAKEDREKAKDTRDIKDAKEIIELLKEQGKLQERPPVVVVMGHVDHGKTKLIEAIRKIELLSKEAGGITQHIGAYQIEHKGRVLTFIDTPGHEAFSAMRSRGANVADVAILVVAADDGVQPQTVEAIEIMEKAQLPFIVAINKIDKPEADQEKIKKQLSELNLIPEEWGGKTICVPISAKKEIGLNDLLDMLVLLVDLEKEKIQANPQRLAVGTIIESKIDKDTGSLATVLVQTGALRVGDLVMAGGVVGKVKALRTWRGENIKEALPSTPVQILGLKGAPQVGDILQATKDKKILKEQTKQYQTFAFSKMKKEEKGKKKILKLIIKADVLGSLEAIVEAINKISHPEVEAQIISKGLGTISEKDIDQTQTSQALLLGFNVEPTATARDYLLGKDVQLNVFHIIYELLDFVKAKLSDLLAPEIIYSKIGEVKILAVFRVTEKYQIVGGRVSQGEIRDKHLVKIIRNGEKVGEGKIVELQSEKKNVSSVEGGKECGIKFEGEGKIETGDVLEIYAQKEKKRTL